MPLGSNFGTLGSNRLHSWLWHVSCFLSLSCLLRLTKHLFILFFLILRRVETRVEELLHSLQLFFYILSEKLNSSFQKYSFSSELDVSDHTSVNGEVKLNLQGLESLLFVEHFIIFGSLSIV